MAALMNNTGSDDSVGALHTWPYDEWTWPKQWTSGRARATSAARAGEPSPLSRAPRGGACVSSTSTPSGMER
eukprot:4461546-Prymnesium_polylepis.1